MIPGKLQPGDIVTFTFGASNFRYMRAYQAMIIEDRLDKNPEDFYVKSIDYLKPGKLVFEIRIRSDASKLYTEKEIAEKLSRLSPMGFSMVFMNAVKREIKEAAEVVVRYR